MPPFAGTRTTLAALLALPLLALAATWQAGETVTVRQAEAGDLYLAGQRVDVLAPVGGDLVAAARELVIRGQVEVDLAAAAERIELDAAVGDDVRAAGRVLRLRAPIGGHLVAAGAEVELGPDASVAENAALAGAEVRIDGRIGGSLRVAANTLRIAGEITGNVEARAEQVELLPGARIGGNLIVRSPTQPMIADGAVVAGELRLQQPPAAPERAASAGIGAALVFALVLLVTAAVIYLLFPRYAEVAAALAQRRPLAALGLGLAVLAAAPLLVIVLLITGLGALLGLALLALYPVALLAGAVSGLFWLGDTLRQLARRPPGRGWTLLALAIAVALMTALSRLPMVGGLLVLLLLLLGLGALTLRLWERYRAPA